MYGCNVQHLVLREIHLFKSIKIGVITYECIKVDMVHKCSCSSFAIHARLVVLLWSSKICGHPYYWVVYTVFIRIVAAATINFGCSSVRLLIEGGSYSKAATIQGRLLFE